jgi:SET domain-containing protein
MTKPKNVVVRRSPIHGNGVFAAHALPAHSAVIRYAGRLLSHDEADARYCDNVETGHTFLFVLNDDYVINANDHGNAARWINHSCEPNCEPVLHESKSGDRRRDGIVIETLRAIDAGEELTYDYGITLSVPHTPRLKKIWACRCGSAHCTGTILQPKRKPKGSAQSK